MKRKTLPTRKKEGRIDCCLCQMSNGHKEKCHYKQYPNFSFNIKCSEHDNEYYYYCEECDISLCKSCLGHYEHSLYYPFQQLNSEFTYISALSQIKETQSKVVKYIKSLEVVLYDESEKTKLKEVEKEIMALFDITKRPVLTHIMELYDYLSYTVWELTELSDQKRYFIRIYYNLISTSFIKNKLHKPFIVFNSNYFIDKINSKLLKQSYKELIDNHKNIVDIYLDSHIIYIIPIENQNKIITISYINVIKSWDLLTLQSGDEIHIQVKPFCVVPEDFNYLLLNNEQIVYFLEDNTFNFENQNDDTAYLIFVNINPLKKNAVVNINKKHLGLLQLYNNQIAVYYKNMTLVIYNTKTYQMTGKFNLEGINNGYGFIIDLLKDECIRLLIPEIASIYYYDSLTFKLTSNIKQKKELPIQKKAKFQLITQEYYQIIPLKNKSKIAFWFCGNDSLSIWDTSLEKMWTKSHDSFTSYRKILELNDNLFVILAGSRTVIVWNILSNQFLHTFTESSVIKDIKLLKNGNLCYYDYYRFLELNPITYQKRLLFIETNRINNCIQLNDGRIISNLIKRSKLDRLH